MNSIKEIHTRFLHTVGITTPLRSTMFTKPLIWTLCIGIGAIAVFIFSLGTAFTILAFGIGVICAYMGLSTSIWGVVQVVEKKSNRLWILFLLQSKVLLFALIFVLCYSLLQLSVFALLFGFTIPLCILGIHICRVYVSNTIIKEI